MPKIIKILSDVPHAPIVRVDGGVGPVTILKPKKQPQVGDEVTILDSGHAQLTDLHV